MANAKRKNEDLSTDPADDLFEQDYEYDDEYDEFDDLLTTKRAKQNNLNHSRNIKRRLDNYKERKWLKEHNWFDEEFYPEEG